MSEFVQVGIKWYPPGQHGPNECDLMRAMMELVNLYVAGAIATGNPTDTPENIDAEISRAVDWLHSKHGSGPRREK